MHDVVFEDGGAAEGAEDADGENGDRNGSRDGEASAEADINRDGSEQEPEERAEDNCAEREFLDGFFGSDVGAEFSWGRSGTPGAIIHGILPRDELKPNWKGARGLCRREGRWGRESCAHGGTGVLLTGD